MLRKPTGIWIAIDGRHTYCQPTDDLDISSVGDWRNFLLQSKYSRLQSKLPMAHLGNRTSCAPAKPSTDCRLHSGGSRDGTGVLRP